MSGYDELMEGEPTKKQPPRRTAGGFRQPKSPPKPKRIVEPSPYEREMEGYPPGDVTVREKVSNVRGHYDPRKQKTDTPTSKKQPKGTTAGGPKKPPRPKKPKKQPPRRTAGGQKRPKRPREILKVREINWI